MTEFLSRLLNIPETPMSLSILPLMLIAGLIDSVAGGGGLISLPALSALGIPFTAAAGTNKFAATFGTAAAASRYALGKKTEWKSALSAIPSALVGSYLGAELLFVTDQRILRIIMLILVPLIAVFTICKRDFGRAEPKGASAVLWLSCAAGLAIGFYDGFFGPGTGTFLTIVYTSLIGFDIQIACGNARLVNLASNLAAIAVAAFNGGINLPLGIAAAVFNTAGGIIGSGLVIKHGCRFVRKILVAVVIMLLIKTAYDLFS